MGTEYFYYITYYLNDESDVFIIAYLRKSDFTVSFIEGIQNVFI